MASKLSVLLLLLTVATVAVLAQRRRPASTTTTGEWNYRDGCEHPDLSLFFLGQRSSSGLIMVMSKLEVKDHTATSLTCPLTCECLFVLIYFWESELVVSLCFMLNKIRLILCETGPVWIIICLPVFWVCSLTLCDHF